MRLTRTFDALCDTMRQMALNNIAATLDGVAWYGVTIFEDGSLSCPIHLLSNGCGGMKTLRMLPGDEKRVITRPY